MNRKTTQIPFDSLRFPVSKHKTQTSTHTSTERSHSVCDQRGVFIGWKQTFWAYFESSLTAEFRAGRAAVVLGQMALESVDDRIRWWNRSQIEMSNHIWPLLVCLLEWWLEIGVDNLPRTETEATSEPWCWCKDLSEFLGWTMAPFWNQRLRELRFRYMMPLYLYYHSVKFGSDWSETKIQNPKSAD